MGRDKRNEKLSSFVPMLHRTMDCPAWLALSPYSRALYPVLKRRAGPRGQKNGSFTMSVREAAEHLGCNKNTAIKAFHELQAKGFAIPKQIGALGSNGEGRATMWRLTEIGTPDVRMPTSDFLTWQPGQDFPIARGKQPPRKAKPCLPS